tara:strand:- start:45 stop:164 length:120 start_codon:yes stop_codon:yes gene_type:complete
MIKILLGEEKSGEGREDDFKYETVVARKFRVSDLYQVVC